jgi:hypothetical protein
MRAIGVYLGEEATQGGREGPAGATEDAFVCKKQRSAFRSQRLGNISSTVHQ